jgi:uncharacterized membrane protein
VTKRPIVVKAASVLALGLVTLFLSSSPAFADEDGDGSSVWCTTDCDWSMWNHSCTQGSKCTEVNCLGINGRDYPYRLNCSSAE